jgi:prephenate dehydrogenase
MAEGRSLPVVQPRDAGQPPIFEKIAIIGLGLIGGSIALAAREKWPKSLVIAVDNKDVLEQAMVRHAIDVAADELYVISEAELVVLAAPVRQNIELLASLDEHVTGEAVVTDVGSTKRAIVDAAKSLPPRLTFVGGHPMGGAARGGFEFARPDLFAGRPWIFTPHTDGAGEVLEKLHRFATTLGAVPKTMTAAAHDHVLAFMSHLPQLAASALMGIVGSAAEDDGLALAGRGLVDTTRLASSPPGIWRDICATNADEIGAALDALIVRLTELRADLEQGDAIEMIFEEAARWRARLTEGRD